MKKNEGMRKLIVAMMAMSLSVSGIFIEKQVYAQEVEISNAAESTSISSGQSLDVVSTEDSHTSYNPPSLSPAKAPTKASGTLVWDGKIDITFEGKGTKSSPYLIYTPQEFAGMCVSSADNKGSYYKLMNDIDLGGKPLRASDPDGEWGGQDWGKLEFNTFYGTFDGDDHLISGFYQKTKRNGYSSYSGVFGEIAAISTVKNVILCGRSDCGPALSDCLLGVVTDCTSYVDCYGDESINGMIGKALENAQISCCYNYGNICGTGYVGGIIGKISDNVTMKKCANFGDIQQKNVNNEILSSQYAGGIVGLCVSESGIADCVNMGNVDSVCYAGGICGSSMTVIGGGFTVTFTVERCCNLGDVVGGNNAYGILQGTANIIDCINKGTISSNSGNVGSIGTGTSNGNVFKCYAISDIEAANSKGYGLADYCDTLSNCYYVGNAENLATKNVENTYCKHWTTYPEDGIIDINGGDFDYFVVNELSKCQNGFPVLSWESESFNISKLKSTSATKNSISLRWSIIPRATGYEIYRCDKNGEMKLLDTVNTNYYQDTSLKVQTKYEYKVRSYLTENGHTFYGEFTDVMSASTLPEYILGDVDSNESITLQDAKLILKAALGITKISNEKIGDIDEDGKITLIDAKIVLSVALGITKL